MRSRLDARSAMWCFRIKGGANSVTARASRAITAA